VLGVARGSGEEPQFIILEYKNGPAKQKPLVLAGKGVTFDTGGINLKPEQGINDMHMDMSGGAAVIHGIAAIARLKISIHVVGLIPAVENMPSGSSYRPGDILRSMSGKTIEIANTDAEGRVILADALFYGATKYRPGLMIDIATLTGAAMVALGSYVNALFVPEQDSDLQKKLVRIGELANDPVWPMPLWDEYLADIKGTFGDIANLGKGNGRFGGATHGAKFLEQFIDGTRWAHIDIAPRMTTTEHDQLAKGASGTGVAYIVELAKTYADDKI
jgi:leucyl aminopeptidase